MMKSHCAQSDNSVVVTMSGLVLSCYILNVVSISTVPPRTNV